MKKRNKVDISKCSLIWHYTELQGYFKQLTQWLYTSFTWEVTGTGYLVSGLITSYQCSKIEFYCITLNSFNVILIIMNVLNVLKQCVQQFSGRINTI